MDEAESTDYSSHGKVFMGSVVTSGEGYMIATVIGDSSELGKINKALTDTSEEEERKRYFQPEAGGRGSRYR